MISCTDLKNIANMFSDIVSAAIAGGVPEPDAITYERGAI
jgi:hypothetical protein